MLAVFQDILDWASTVNWFRALFNLIVVAAAVVLAIWLPGRALEYHTNQRGVRYIWYVIGSLVLVMVYLCMYGYGRFWDTDWQSVAR